MTVTAEVMDPRTATKICDILNAESTSGRGVLDGWESLFMERVNRMNRMQNRPLGPLTQERLEQVWRKVFP